MDKNNGEELSLREMNAMLSALVKGKEADRLSADLKRKKELAEIAARKRDRQAKISLKEALAAIDEKEGAQRDTIHLDRPAR